MKKLQILNRIYQSGALAVVRAKPERVSEIADGILRGHVDVMEISYTNPTAPAALDLVREKFNNQILVGAGTILDTPTAKDAISHGAQFIYSPIFDRDVAYLCNQYQIPYAPGCTSVSEMINAARAGASFIKVFPYSGILGPSAISTIKTPLPDLPLLESGGVNPENITTWLDAGVDIVGIGGAFSKGSVEDISHNAQIIRNKIDEFRQQKEI